MPHKVAVPAHATPSGDGIVVGSGHVQIDALIDFRCPFCRQFEERSGSLLKNFVDDLVATLVYHPLGFLDRLSVPSGYSTRAAAASAASSDAHVPAYKDALFANQPEEGGPGLDDEELVDLGRSVGIEDPRFAVFSGTYQPWVRFVTELAVERGSAGRPRCSSPACRSRRTRRRSPPRSPSSPTERHGSPPRGYEVVAGDVAARLEVDEVQLVRAALGDDLRRQPVTDGVAVLGAKKSTTCSTRTASRSRKPKL